VIKIPTFKINFCLNEPIIVTAKDVEAAKDQAMDDVYDQVVKVDIDLVILECEEI
jgi:hypothetical protein